MNASNLNPIAAFEAEKEQSVSTYAANKAWKQLSRSWMEEAFRSKYMYNFTCLGRPIIQTPVDMVALQEIVWSVRPDLVIETGIAHGGSLILSAAQLALLDYCDAVAAGETLDPAKPRRRVLGIDIDIRAHNRDAIKAHPLANRIDMIEGSSIAPETIKKVKDHAAGYKRILVCLDSNHTHEHVLAELEAYAPLATRGSYCLVFDTVVEDLPDGLFPNRPWKRGDNPKTVVHAYLKRLKEKPASGADGAPLSFEIDRAFEDKLMLTVAPDGYLKRT